MLRKKLKRGPVTVSGRSYTIHFRMNGAAGNELEPYKIRIEVSEVETQVRERYRVYTTKEVQTRSQTLTLKAPLGGDHRHS